MFPPLQHISRGRYRAGGGSFLPPNPLIPIKIAEVRFACLCVELVEAVGIAVAQFVAALLLVVRAALASAAYVDAEVAFVFGQVEVDSAAFAPKVKRRFDEMTARAFVHSLVEPRPKAGKSVRVLYFVFCAVHAGF